MGGEENMGKGTKRSMSDVQSTVIPKKRTKQREKTERNQGHILKNPGKKEKAA